jgi:hypothetical protein
VGDRNGVTHLSRRRSGFDHVIENLATINEVDFEVRPMATIDTLAQLLAVDRIDVMKIDVEGYELKVLRGATGLLSKGRIGSIVLESDGHDLRYGSSEAQTIDFLKQTGYAIDETLSLVGQASGNCLVFHPCAGY